MSFILTKFIETGQIRQGKGSKRGIYKSINASVIPGSANEMKMLNKRGVCVWWFFYILRIKLHIKVILSFFVSP